MIAINDGLMILAVLCSPFIAVFIQRQIDIGREKRGQKLWIFRTLMATRANRLSLDHVQALNSIELVFDKKKKDKAIIEKWNEYLDYFGQCPKEGDENYSVKLDAWLARGEELFANLMHVMGKQLGYDFDRVRIKRSIYFPKGHGDEFNDHFLIRKGLVAILNKKSNLSVEVINQEAKAPTA